MLLAVDISWAPLLRVMNIEGDAAEGLRVPPFLA
jgi:hypothetical protein